MPDSLHSTLIYDAAIEPGLWSDVSTKLAQAYDGCAVLFAEDARMPDASIFGAGLFDSDRLQAYEKHYFRTNVWTPLVEPLPTGSIFDSCVVPKADFERSEFYNDWLKPQDLYHSIGSVIANESGVQTRLSILRPHRAGAFREDEKRAWGILSAHVQRAIQIHRKLAVARLQRDAANDGLDRLGIAAFIVDGDGRILSANSRGMALLEDGDALAAPAGRLAGLRPQATDRLRHLIGQASRTAVGVGLHPGGAISLPRRDGPPLSALVSPMPGDVFGMGIPMPAALLYVRDPSRPAVARPADLKALFGLTDAEAALAAAVADGLSLDEIAAARGISMNTARSHLKRLMSKAQVTRQAELVSLLLRSAATLAERPAD